MTGVLIERMACGERNMHIGRTPGEDGVRDQGDASEAKGC